MPKSKISVSEILKLALSNDPMGGVDPMAGADQPVLPGVTPPEGGKDVPGDFYSVVEELKPLGTYLDESIKIVHAAVALDDLDEKTTMSDIIQEGDSISKVAKTLERDLMELKNSFETCVESWVSFVQNLEEKGVAKNMKGLSDLLRGGTDRLQEEYNLHTNVPTKPEEALHGRASNKIRLHKRS